MTDFLMRSNVPELIEGDEKNLSTEKLKLSWFFYKKKAKSKSQTVYDFVNVSHV